MSGPQAAPLDYFFWSFLKEKVFNNGDKPSTFNELKIKIETVIQTISGAQLQSAIGNLVYRVEACLRNNGGHFE